MAIFKREMYLKKIRPFIGSELVKVFTGMRRCGKSTVMDMVIAELKEKGIKNILKLDFESKVSPKFNNDDDLYDYIIKWSGKKKEKKYIFLDEIQNVPKWELCVRSLIKDIDCDIYLTGSSSKMLSGELATHISGRYVEIPISPFSFSEVSEIIGSDDEKLFYKYLKNGGMPLAVMCNYDEDMVPSILEGMYDSVIVNDIAARNSIRDTVTLKTVLSYAVSEVGHTMSAKSISDYLKSQKKTISVDTVINYLEYARDAIFFRRIKRYDIRGKEVLKTECKYYITDIGLRQTIGYSNTASIDQTLENIVFNELFDRGYEVKIGKIGNVEIDFVATKKNKTEYYQVAYLIDTNENREFGNLLEIGDNHPKFVLSMDKADLSRGGIVHKNIIDWLLGR